MLGLYFQNKAYGNQNCFFFTKNSHGASKLVTAKKWRHYSFTKKGKWYFFTHSFFCLTFIERLQGAKHPYDNVHYILPPPPPTLILSVFCKGRKPTKYEFLVFEGTFKNIYRLNYLIENRKLVLGIYVHIHIFFSLIKTYLHICAQD